MPSVIRILQLIAVFNSAFLSPPFSIWCQLQFSASIPPSPIYHRIMLSRFFLGLPRFLFPSTFRTSTASSSLRSTWPTRLWNLLLMSSRLSWLLVFSCAVLYCWFCSGRIFWYTLVDMFFGTSLVSPNQSLYRTTSDSCTTELVSCRFRKSLVGPLSLDF